MSKHGGRAEARWFVLRTVGQDDIEVVGFYSYREAVRFYSAAAATRDEAHFDLVQLLDADRTVLRDAGRVEDVHTWARQLHSGRARFRFDESVDDFRVVTGRVMHSASPP